MHTTLIPTTTTAAAASSTTARPAGRRPARRGATRHAARLAVVALGISAAFGSFAGAAHAETPPAPKPQLPIAIPAPPLVPNLPYAQPTFENDGFVADVHATTGDTWADVTFISNKPKVTVQLSKTAPYLKDGKLTVGAVPPVYLNGTAVVANQVPTGLYSYSMKPQALTPSTTYHLLATINGNAGQEPNQMASSFKTKVRHVRATVQTIYVSYDGDPGANAGDLRFGARIAPESGLGEAKAFSGWTEEMKIDSDHEVNLANKGVGQEVTTQAGWAWVQIQGIDADGVGFCPTGTPVTPTNGSGKCYDMAYAQGLASLPTAKFTGVHKQVIDVNVIGDQPVHFQAKVLVETWYS